MESKKARFEWTGDEYEVFWNGKEYADHIVYLNVTRIGGSGKQLSYQFATETGRVVKWHMSYSRELGEAAAKALGLLSEPEPPTPTETPKDEPEQEQSQEAEPLASTPDLKTALDSFLKSDDFKSGVISSTKAGFGGSSYKVELFEDGTYRVLWANQIGNRYETPGAILDLPQLDAEDLEEIEGWTEEEVQDNAFSIRADEIEQELRRELDFILEQREEAAKKQRGGARPGAGRKRDPESFDQRSYNAGYQAGKRGGWQPGFKAALALRQQYADVMDTIFVCISARGGEWWILNQKNKGVSPAQWHQECLDALEANGIYSEEVAANLRVISLATLEQEQPELFAWWLQEADAHDNM